MNLSENGSKMSVDRRYKFDPSFDFWSFEHFWDFMEDWIDAVEYKSSFQSSFSFRWRWHGSAWKGPYALCAASQQSPQGCLRNSANVWLNTDGSWSQRVECQPLPFSTPLSFRQSGLSVFRKFLKPLSSEHLCPAKQQTRCDICCACQSVWLSES